jgi:hypothetical protein
MSKTNARPEKPLSSMGKRRSKKSKPVQHQLRTMIEEAAYYKAEQRNFAPGFEELDWFEAEKEITGRLKKD